MTAGPISPMAGWPEVTIADLTTKVGSGATPRGGSSTYLGSRVGFALIRSQNVLDRQFDRSGLAYISDEQAYGLRGVVVQRNDVLLNITGDGVTFARACLVPEDVRPACVNQHVAIVRADPEKADPGYLLAYLTHPDVKRYIESFNAGGSRRAITKGHIESFRLPQPPVNEQRTIAATLGALDDKVESNRRAVDVAELLGDQLFASGVAAAVSLKDVAALTMGSSPPGSTYNEAGSGLPFYQGVRDFGRRYPGHRVWTTGPVRVARDNDTLVSVRAPVGELNRARETCCIGRGVAAVSSDYASTVFYALRASDATWEPFQQEGTVFGAINKGDLSNARLPWPSSTALVGVEARLAAIDAKVRSLINEIERLTALRDVLLPELLSGRIRVPEAAEALEVVA
jgi:type I restriction enzyme S subunit